jgi:hypothetical protein
MEDERCKEENLHKAGQLTDKEEGGYERTSTLYKGNFQEFICNSRL